MDARTEGAPAEGPVVVVGGGLVGLCCALHLRRSGHAVVLVDPGDVRRAASFGNAGQLAVGEVVPLSVPGILYQVPKWLLDQLGPLAIRWRHLPHLAPWLIRFLRAGRRDRVEEISRTMAVLCDHIALDYDPLIAAAGVADIVGAGPYLRLYKNREEWQAEGYRWQLRERSGLRFETIEAPALRTLEPAVADRFGFAVGLTERRFIGDPERLMRAFVALLVREGGTMVTGEAADFERSGDRVTGVRLIDGRVIAAGAIVIAAGAWSHRLSARLGDRVPLESERGYHVMLPDPGVRIVRTVSYVARGVVMVPMEQGLRVTGVVELGGLEAPPDPRRFDRLLEAARIALPSLRATGGVPWMGHRPSLPDSLPIIDRSSRFANAFYAFGHGHMGLSWAATTGRLLAALVDRRAVNFDMRPFRLARF